MDYSKVFVPRLEKEFIEKEADKIRKDYKQTTIPINIENIIEKMGIQIVPTKDLLKKGAEAFINSRFDSIYVDLDSYMDDRRYPRLRFSLAHEIAHYVLHRKIYASFGIKEIEDVYRFYKEIPEVEYSSCEWQANKFANFLLVPRDILKIKKEEILNSEAILKNNIKLNNEILATLINSHSKFEVSNQVVAIALQDI